MKKISLVFVLLFLISTNAFANQENFDLSKHINAFPRPFSPEIIISKFDFWDKKVEELSTNIHYFWKDNSPHENSVYIDNVIPILKKFWKENIKKLVENNVINIFWSKRIHWNEWNNCEKNYEDCLFDEKKYNYLNTKYTKYYKIHSDKSEQIEIILYPISPDYFVYDSYAVHETKIENSIPERKEISRINPLFLKSPKITFFDTTLEFYDLKASLLWNINKDIEFIKDYKLVKFPEWNYMYIPYYKSKIYLSKWENYLEVLYSKATVDFNFYYLEFK